MGKMFDSQFANVADYDCIVQIQFRDIEQFIALKSDPEYKQTIFADHEKFADTKRSKWDLGSPITAWLWLLTTFSLEWQLVGFRTFYEMERLYDIRFY